MTTNNLMDLKVATYNFIKEDLNNAAEAVERDTPAMLYHYLNQWMKEAGNDRANISKFVRDYVLNYPMIPFSYYDIDNFIESLEIETTDKEETYLSLVTLVITDLLDPLDSNE